MAALTVSITDAAVSAQGVTAFKILVGTATGGPYTLSSASVNVSSMTLNGSVYSIPLASVSFSPALANFTTYFAVAEAENSTGASVGSPEATFQILSVPSAPTAFSIA